MDWEAQFLHMFPEEAAEHPVFEYCCRKCGRSGKWLELLNQSPHLTESECFDCGGVLDLQLSHLERRISTHYLIHSPSAHQRHMHEFDIVRASWLSNPVGRIEPDIEDEP